MATTTAEAPRKVVIKPKKPAKAAKKAAKPKKKEAKKAKQELLPAITVFSYDALAPADANKLKSCESLVIKHRQEGALAAAKMGQALRTAKTLCQAKMSEHPSRHLSPYNWRLWLSQTVQISRQTADRAIALFELFETRLETLKGTSLTGAYAIAAAPDPEAIAKKVDKLVQKGETVDEVKVKQIVRELHPHDDARKPAPKLAELPPAVDLPEVAAGEVVEDKAAACERGGDHDWTSDGNGGRFCSKCDKVYEDKKVRVPRDSKSEIYSCLSKLIKLLKAAGIYEKCLPELRPLHARLADL